MRGALLFFCSLISTLYTSQAFATNIDALQLFSKVRNAYSALNMVTVKAEMKLYAKDKNDAPIEELNAVYKLKDSCMMYNLGNYVFVSNKAMQLYVNKEDKIIEVYRPQPVGFMQLTGMDTILNSNIDIKINEDSKYYIVQGSFKGSSANDKKSLLYINKHTYMVDKLVMFTTLYDYSDDFTEAPAEQSVRFEISYLLDASPGLKEKDFSESLFIDYKSPKQILPAKALTGYKIINHLN